MGTWSQLCSHAGVWIWHLLASVSPMLVELSWKTKGHCAGRSRSVLAWPITELKIKELGFFCLSEFNETLIKANLSRKVSRALIFQGYFKINLK